MHSFQNISILHKNFVYKTGGLTAEWLRAVDVIKALNHSITSLLCLVWDKPVLLMGLTGGGFHGVSRFRHTYLVGPSNTSCNNLEKDVNLKQYV